MPQNDNPFRVWNSPMHDSPSAPHNGIDADNPFKPWNSPFGKESDLTDREAASYGIRRRSRHEEQEDDY